MMLNFLRQSRKFVNTKEATCIVIGNESCDLDSACSAICLSFFLNEDVGHALKHIKAKQFLPVLNIPRRDYAIKTEVQYLLTKYEISDAMLTFRDDLCDDFLARSEFILVDHHVSPFAARSVAVYDHRPKDENALFPKGCLVNIDLVLGSCATLIGDVYFNKDANFIDINRHEIALNLLRNTIVLDTVNFAPKAGRFKEKDVLICGKLECLLQTRPGYLGRENVFQELCKARADISHLTASQLLRKDLKILRNSSSSLGNVGIALAGFPLQVQQFIKKTDAEKAIRDFASEQDCVLILLIGMHVRNEDNGVERDIGIISIGENNKIRNLVEQSLLASKDPALELELYENCKFMEGRYYKQNNITATRKHILPVVKHILENYHY